ncbi:MAG: DNA repair protein RadC [Paludibacteraceae bacterium]|nr:DNA repair protein RadC [Paludibacteraceae bacterium]
MIDGNMEVSSIKLWAEEDRPREKLLNKGTEALSNAELLAILIGSGSRKESAVDLCKRILESVGNSLDVLGRKTVLDYMQFNGIGEAKALTIVAAMELGRRRKLSEVQNVKQIKASCDIFDIMQPVLADLEHEEIWAIYMNRANRVLNKRLISSGGLVSSVFDVRIVIRHAILMNATVLALCHNHPSGNAKPSHSDKMITDMLKKACGYFDISFIDHLIVAGNNFYSFSDAGEL